MEWMAALGPLVLRASLFLFVFALGLGATPADATYLFRRPGLLLRSIVSMNLLVPLFVALVVAVFHLRPTVEVGLLLMAVSPVPPVLPLKQLKSGGRTAYVYGLLVATSLLSVVLVPITVALLSAAFSARARVSPGQIAGVVLATVLLPLGAGIAVRRAAPAAAERVARPVSRGAGAALLVAVLAILVSVGPGIWSLVGNGTVIAIALVVGVSLLLGHALGGPDPTDRVTLALASATRHPGVALLIGTANFPGAPLAAAVLLYLIVASLISLPYLAWWKRRGTSGGVASSAA